jgi:hypothetical protein
MLLLLPLFYFLYININCQIYAQNKQCANCKYFIPHKNNKIVSLGLCRMFGNKVNSNGNEKMIYNFAEHCRDDENLCGKNASLYEKGITINLEPKKNNTNDIVYNISENKLSIMDDEMKKLINDYYKFLRNEPDL